MNRDVKVVFLAGETPVEVRLSAGASGGTVKVSDSGGDLGGGLIQDVALMTAGVAYPLKNEPFEIDETCLRQLAGLINKSADGVKCRYTHPELQKAPYDGYEDPLSWLVGRVKNARLVGAGKDMQVRGDVHLGTYADEGPNGRLGTRVKGIAKSSPADCGMSAAAGFIYERRGEQIPVGRVVWCSAVDFVGDAGSNPNGLLAGQRTPTRDEGDGTPASQGDTPMKLTAMQRAYLSSCGLPKDASNEQILVCLAGLNASQKSYFDSLGETAGGGATPPGVDEAQRRTIAEQAVAADRKRREDIVALAQKHNLPETWAIGVADRGVSIEQATELVSLAAASSLLPQAGGPRIEVGDNVAMRDLRPAMTDAILLSGGVQLYEFDRRGLAVRNADGSLKVRQPSERAAKLVTLSLARKALEFLRSVGCEDWTELSDGQAITLAMDERAFRERYGAVRYLSMSSTDFPSILGNTMRATIRAMHAESEQGAVWPLWCGRLVLPDYRAMDLVSVSEVPDLLLRPEGGEVRFATFTDGHESIRVAMFSRGMAFTQQAQKNDMFGVFVRQIRGFAGAFTRLLDRGSTAVLTANANMADGVPLFNAAHNNVPNPDAALSTAALSAARTALRTQVGMRTAEDGDSGPAILNIRARTVLTSAALEDTARTILSTQQVIVNGVGQDNPVRNMANTVGNPYLDAAGAAASWFVLGDPNQPGGGVQVAFLQGEEAPDVRTQVNFRTGDLEVVCEGKAGWKADDFRGLYRGHV